MKRCQRNQKGSRWAIALLLGVVASRPTLADDWLQFRRDERRTGASQDRLQLPLINLWSVPGYGTATWRGNVFYLGPDGERAAVYCADLRTGVTRWKQTLTFPWSDTYGTSKNLPAPSRSPVAVSSEGTVYVQDYLPHTRGIYPAAPVLQGIGRAVAFPFSEAPRGIFRAFRATDGAPVSTTAQPRDILVPPTLLYDDAGAGLFQVPAVLRSMMPVGPALLQGNDVVATSMDCIFRWTPGGAPNLLPLAHSRPRNKVGPPFLEVSMGGFPPTSTGSGVVVGGSCRLEAPWDYLDGDKQFLSLIEGGRCAWHRDYPWSLGIPTVEKSLVLTSAGDRGAWDAVMAHDATTGAVRWTYPQDRLSPDGVGRHTINANTETFYTAIPHAYRFNPGIAISNGRAIAAVRDSIVALRVETGELLWSWPFATAGAPQSIVTTPDYVMVCAGRSNAKGTSGKLTALRATDGKPAWSLDLPAGGDLALAEGLLFKTDQSLNAFAPAERTFRLAVDSDRPEDYDAHPGLNREPVSQPDGRAAEKFVPTTGVADATIVRINWGQPVDQILKLLRERRAMTPGMPLLVSLDWLDPTRTTLRGGQPEWSQSEVAAFVALCERIAREVGPEHLDLAPEVNVWVQRDPRRKAAVRKLIRTAAAAVKRDSPGTRVLISFNREALGRRYGRGSILPFGKLGLPTPEEQRLLLSLLDEVDEVGLTSLPQAAFSSPAQLPGDYLLALRSQLPKKPLLITRVAVARDPMDKAAEISQATYLQQLIRSTYWLNAELIAYPEFLHNPPAPGASNLDVTLRVEQRERLALTYWRDTLHWKRVSQLSAAAAKLESKPLP